jgi:hypothetical protein
MEGSKSDAWNVGHESKGHTSGSTSREGERELEPPDLELYMFLERWQSMVQHLDESGETVGIIRAIWAGDWVSCNEVHDGLKGLLELEDCGGQEGVVSRVRKQARKRWEREWMR